MVFNIYQIKYPTSDIEQETYRKYVFSPLNWIDYVDMNRYEKVWTGPITDSDDIYETLEKIFEIFNIHKPANFHGHSLSVSDIVEINNKYYYCDSMGWVEVEFD